MKMTITHIGGPTALLEIGGLRLLTDPVFDPPGDRYSFGFGTSSRKLGTPALATDSLGPIDAVLLSHDGHEDNLDRAGRALLPKAGRVITTAPGARRLGGNAVGLDPWSAIELPGTEGSAVKVTATPARHGIPLSRPFVGAVIGFALEWPQQQRGALWISGDTVYYRGIQEIGRRLEVGTALLHIGAARFPITGPARYTMNAHEAARTIRELDIATAIPVHYEGWSHFREDRGAAEASFSEEGVADRVRWLEIGEPATVEV
jgi:L-ascorbate metabolism protein UlaG (beta-lactamase superfamily)